MPELLTITEAAEYKDCSTSFIYKKIRAGEIDFEKEKRKAGRNTRKIKVLKKEDIDNIKFKRGKTIEDEGEGRNKQDVLRERMKRLREMGDARKGPMVDLIINALIRNKEAENAS